MSQWGFYFDQSRCVGCKACVLACKNWNEERRGDASINVLDLVGYQVYEGQHEKNSYIDETTGETNYNEYRKYYMKENWRRVETYDSGYTHINQTDNTFEFNIDRRYISLGCNHCDNPACVRACPVGAIHKEPDKGIVLVDSSICISCGRCKTACAWGVPQFYDDPGKYSIDNPARPRMTKCTLCKDRIDVGLKPACVAACWNRALQAGPIEQLKADNPDYVETLPDFKTDESIGIKSEPNIIFKSK